MECNFLNFYKVTGRKIDNKIKKLMKIWESPHYLFNGHQKNNEETTINLNNLILPISEIQKDFNEDTKNRHNYLNDMDKFLHNCQTINNELKQAVDDIECLFSEYGFSRLPSELDEKLDALTLEQIDNVNISLRSNSIEQIDKEIHYEEDNCNNTNDSLINDIFFTPLRGYP